MPSPSVTVIVLNWNGRLLLQDCLHSLALQTFQDFEIILVDNGSTDGSVEWVTTRYPNVRVIPLERNLGFSAGNNIGIRAARGEYVALLNNDTWAEENWLEELVKAMRERHDIAFCASRMLLFHHRDVVDSAGDYFGVNGVGGKRGHLRSADQYGERTDVFGACAGAALYRRAMLDRIGLLDEDFFLIFEDVDLSFRAQLAGYRCLYVPTARVFHKVNASIGTYSHNFVYYGHRNLEFVYIKNMPTKLFIKYLPIHVAYNLLALIFFTRHGKFSSIVRAKLAVVRALPRLMRQRRRIQTSRTASDGQIEGLFTESWLRERWTSKGRYFWNGSSS